MYVVVGGVTVDVGVVFGYVGVVGRHDVVVFAVDVVNDVVGVGCGTAVFVSRWCCCC